MNAEAGSKQPFELPDFYVGWPARLNPNVEAARAHTKAWARGVGILDTPPEDETPEVWTEAALDAMDYGLLCAYQKEIQYEGELHNLVLIVESFLGIERTQAVAVVNDLMTARMRQFEHIVATEVPYVADSFELDDDDRATLDAWVTSLQDWLAGIFAWNQITRRYDEAELRDLDAFGTLVAGGRPRALSELPVGPVGLGTAAARIGSPRAVAPLSSAPA